MDRSENPYPYFDLKITSNCCCFSDELLLFDNSSRWVISDISRVFLGQTGAYIESRLAPSGNIFKSCASRCSKKHSLALIVLRFPCKTFSKLLKFTLRNALLGG